MHIVILSPHFDDAVGSLGGLIQRLVARRQVPTVVTSTGGLPSGSEDRDYVVRRRREDDRACRVIGCNNDVLPILDASFRMDSTGEPLYPSVFTPIRPDDDVVDRIVRELAPFLRAEGVVLYAPAAIGGHVDHLACRAAAEQLKSRVTSLLWYRDFFYHRENPDDPPGLVRSRIIALTARELQLKIAAFTKYRSQLQGLYGDVAEMKRSFETCECDEVVYTGVAGF